MTSGENSYQLDAVLECEGCGVSALQTIEYESQRVYWICEICNHWHDQDAGIVYGYDD